MPNDTIKKLELSVKAAKTVIKKVEAEKKEKEKPKEK